MSDILLQGERAFVSVLTSWKVRSPLCLLIAAALLLSAVLIRGAGPLAVGPISITVSDMEQSVAFYTNVLTFRKIADRDLHNPAMDKLFGLFGARVHVVKLRLGDEELELMEFRNFPGRPVPIDSQSNDQWFQHIAIVVNDMDAAVRRLEAHRVKPTSVAAQKLPDWNPNAGGIRAFYFRDPDNHNLEVIYFPPGKGDPRWQTVRTGTGQSPFLGIDHTAIVVTDTDRSLRFYRDTLGFRVAGESRNWGIEQEYLNHIEGARLRITGLRAGSGPGIEFLEYEKPNPGRPFPNDTRPSDIVHWQIGVRFSQLGPVAAALSGNRSRWISIDVVTLPQSLPWSGEAVLLRDPDGHALLVNSPKGDL
ncbi:MAG TPA: VOC family protein [Chthoniobacterales bacterium]